MKAKKKISEEQFVLDCINKEFEIIGSDLHWDTFAELSEWSKRPENKDWFSKFEFSTKEQYEQWKQFYINHYYDWQPRYHSKREVEQISFPWFSLSYGFAERWEK